MTIEPLGLKGLAIIAVKRFGDERGFFTERFRSDVWQKLMPEHRGFIQDNYSWSHYGVLRGLHYQVGPAQGKLVTCMAGTILDVAVDIRQSSPTFGQHVTIELNGEDPKWLWIPPGFAHGFATTSEGGAGVLYKVDAPYTPSGEGAIRYDDATLNIDWGLREPKLNGKDLAAKSFKDYVAKPAFAD